MTVEVYNYHINNYALYYLILICSFLKYQAFILATKKTYRKSFKAPLLLTTIRLVPLNVDPVPDLFDSGPLTFRHSLTVEMLNLKLGHHGHR